MEHSFEYLVLSALALLLKEQRDDLYVRGAVGDTTRELYSHLLNDISIGISEREGGE